MPPVPPRGSATVAVLAPLVAAGLALASLHVALRTGWAPGVVLLAAVALSAAGRQGGERVAPSVAYGTSLAAGASSTVSVVVSALAAHAMITGRHPSVAAAGGYLAGAGLLGIVLAARMRGVVLDRGGLPFPTGAAAAAASRAILRRSDEGGGRRALLIGLGVGGAVALLGPGLRSIAAATGEVGWSRLALPHAIPWLGALLSAMGVGGTWSAFALEASTVPAAVGVLVGPRVAVGVAIGALLGPGVAGSWAVSVGAITGSGFREVVQWTLWPGTGALVAASITGVIAAGRGGGVARTWGMLRSKTTLVAAAAATALAWGACVWGFGVPAFVAFVAVALAALLVPIAVRVTGETDVTPSGPLGKLAQLVAGIVAPGAPAVGVAAAGISAGAATAAGELMTDLRLGRDLGAEPRTQAVRQAAGLLLGIACVVPVYLWGLVPDPAALGGVDVPVPAAQVWRAVAALLAGGLAVLPAGAAEAFLVAVTAATVATWAGVRMPRIGRWIPSFVGVGLGCVLPPMTSMGFAVGGLAVAAVRSARWRRGLGAAAAGALAGEGVASVLFGFLGHLA